jgi:hypothetical protein
MACRLCRCLPFIEDPIEVWLWANRSAGDHANALAQHESHDSPTRLGEPKIDSRIHDLIAGAVPPVPQNKITNPVEGRFGHYLMLQTLHAAILSLEEP